MIAHGPYFEAGLPHKVGSRRTSEGRRCGLRRLVAQIDDAEAVALRICEDDEVRVFRVSVPIDTLGAERQEPLDLSGLLHRRGDVQVEVDPRMLLRGRLAPLE